MLKSNLAPSNEPPINVVKMLTKPIPQKKNIKNDMLVKSLLLVISRIKKKVSVTKENTSRMLGTTIESINGNPPFARTAEKKSFKNG